MPLEVGDHIAKPINKGKTNQVKQQHARYYAEYGDKITPVANIAIDALAKQIRNLTQFKELQNWHLTEIGYQHYRNKDDFIGPHRDRGSDKLLSLTFSITGSALIKIFRMLDIAGDYSPDNLEQTDECMTRPRMTMFLRAPGFGSGEQIIHQVLPPETDERTILNLRMRPTILEQPSDPKWTA